MVSFLCRLSLSMCNVRMCSSLSTILLFLIMTYDETAFQQDGRRKRRNEQLIEFRRRKQEKREKKINALRERNKSRLTVGPINDDTRRWRRRWGFYLPSRNIDVHECTCDRRCRGQNRWNPPWTTNAIRKINFIFHIVFVIRGGFHLFRPLQCLLHVHSWTSTFLLGK